MKVTGIIGLTVHDKEINGKTIRSYSGQISRKKKDDKGEEYWESAHVEVVFAMASLKEITERPLELDTGYQIEVLDGFLSFRKYLAKDNVMKTVLNIVITDHKQLSKHKFSK